jgi:hypothetical protein
MADLYQVSTPAVESMPDPARRQILRLPEPRPRRTPKSDPAAEVVPEEVEVVEEGSKRQLDVTA